MHRIFARRPLRQRIVALIAAYAIALASLLAGLGAAQAAAQAAAQSLDAGVSAICHSEAEDGGKASGSHESNGAICLKSCIGCMTALASIIPPAPTAGPQNLSFKRIDLPAFSLLRDNARSKAHRSRGPPPAL